MTQDQAREKIYEIAERNGYRSRTDVWIEKSKGIDWPEMNEPDFSWIVETLLPRHSGYEIKRGLGVVGAIFGVNSRYPSKRTVRPPACLYLCRFGWTIADVSWRECLNPANKRFKVRNAMRNAIRPQVAAWKDKCFLECVICGDPLDAKNFDADHHPLTFDDIVTRWMKERGLTHETIETNGMDDFVRGDKFVSDELAADWLKYHADHANYRQLCTTCHRKAGR